jgi:nitrite reductase (NADH) small subunit
MTAVATEQWVGVCPLSDLVPDRGVAALVGSEQVAIFLVDDDVYALSNHDPFSHANVMSRGLVGTRGDVVKVASPMYKQSFDLRTGECLDDPTVALDVFPVRVASGVVEVARCGST